jgi:capsular exopolysaccharide synthesis family protein
MTLLRKHAVWLILATMAGVAGAWVAYASHPVRYLSIAEVDVEPHLVALATPPEPNMATEEQVATSGIVLAGAARALHTSALSLQRYVTASAGHNTGSTASGSANVLSIGCTMPRPAAAQRCATAAVYSYMAYRNEAGTSRFTKAHDPLQVRLITPATLPGSPAGTSKRILLPIGALLGLAVGVGGIFVRDHFDQRVRDGGDLERCLVAPVLGAIPRAPRRSGHPALATHDDPLSPLAEAYRYLREHLDSMLEKTPGGGTVLLVASPQPRDGRTSVAVNLASVLAEAGTTVALVDADLRRPSLNQIFSVSQRPGLTELLAGRASLREVLVQTADLPGLRLLPSGVLGDPSAQTFQVGQLDRVFSKIRAEADVVIVDSAPVLAVPQAIALARVSDVVVIVADVRRTTRNAVSTAVQQIRSSGPRIIVGVLNGVPSARNGRTWPGAAPAPESAVRAYTLPEMLESTVPPRGPNKHGPAVVGQPGMDSDLGDGGHP